MYVVEDPYFELPANLPFAPGASPFHIRGNGYTGDKEFYASHVPGGLEALLRELNDATLRHFLVQSFDSDAWYDLVPKLYIGSVAARMRRVPLDMHVRQVSRWHALQQFRGIYRSLLKMVSAETIAVWLPRLATSFQDFGTMDANVVGPKLVRGVRGGMPRITVQWYAGALAGYIEAVFELAGTQGGRVRVLVPERAGERLGQELFRMPFEISWT